MQKTGLLSLLTWMAATVVSASWAFDINATDPKIDAGEQNDFFSYKVLQFISGKERGVVVSAPLQLNGSDLICKCVDNSTGCYTPAEKGSLKHTGLSVADDSNNPPKFIACGPGLAHECHGNSYLNSQFQVTSNFTPDFQECTIKKVDLVFLFDGSESMTTDDFEKNKDFIWDIMKTFKNSPIQFAAVQFSNNPRKVFDFDDYQQKRAFDKLKEEKHMKALTNTHKAIDFVLTSIFDNTSAGAAPDATKVLVIITDGNPSDLDRRYQSIKRSEEKQIIRFVIGVGNIHLRTLQLLASDKNNAFKIENYNGLSGIRENFQKKMFNIEGTKTARAGDMKKEMSQSGFSALFQKDILVLGSVGSNECNGSLSETRGAGPEEKDMLDPTLERDSYRERTMKKVNLVFLFDGSESMTTDDFEENKDFIWDIMKTFKNSPIQFAAVQFSNDPRKVFDFDDYQQKRAFDKLKEEKHMKALTNTHKAIDFVLTSIFDNPSVGAAPDATKVLVIITDGYPTDSDRRYQSIKRSEEKQIIRFVIGVKNVNLIELEYLASDPKKNNTFKIENYDGLIGILDNFCNKIFNIEGTRTDLAGNLKEEMLQSYSLAIAKKNDHPDLLYFTGAPRSGHRGMVLLFRTAEGTWTMTQRLSGEQIGSYFGAELCSVDVDSDNNTDFLLVGAPMFHQSQSEGRIYVYTLTDKLELQPVMSVSGPSGGRFGSSISSLTDLNGDGLRDVAVGAPLEDDRRGAVYIYLGHQLRGIRHQYSQRLSAEMNPCRLQFFSKMLFGTDGLDEEDGLQ